MNWPTEDANRMAATKAKPQVANPYISPIFRFKQCERPRYPAIHPAENMVKIENITKPMKPPAAYALWPLVLAGNAVKPIAKPSRLNKNPRLSAVSAPTTIAVHETHRVLHIW